MRFVSPIALLAASVAITYQGCSSEDTATTVLPETSTTTVLPETSTTTVTPETSTTTETPETSTTTATPTTAFPEPNMVSQCPASRKSGDRREKKDTLKIMHWNTEWLFREMTYGERAEPGIACPGSCDWETNAQALTHVEAIQDFLDEIDADIFALNEVQDCSIMHTAALHGKNKHSPYMVWGADTYTGQNVGLVSRIDPSTDLELMTERENYPIEGSQCGWKLDKPKTRAPTKNYITTFEQVEGLDKPLTMIGAHLIAVPTDRERCSKREAEATVLAKRAQKAVDAGHHVIITGDFNDFDDKTLDHDGSMPTSQVLSILRLGGKLRSAVEKLPQEKRLTYDSEKYGKQSLDHFLMDEELYAKVKDVTIRYDVNDDAVRSDHFPIIVSFDLKKSTTLIA